MSGTPELTQAYWSLEASRPAYERAGGFYDGTVSEFHASPRVQRLLQKYRLRDMDSFNFAHIPVDAVADKLYINNLTSGVSAVDAVIEDIWDVNELGLEAPILHRNVCKFGDAYVFVWPSADADGEDITGVDMIVEDPVSVRVFYDLVNPRKKTHAIKSWCEGQGAERTTYAFMYYPDRVERYAYKGRVTKSDKGQDKWEPYTADGQEAVIENPLGFVPFYHFRTDRPYGVPEHINAYGPQLTLNKLVTSHVSTIDYQSFPQRYTLAEAGTTGPNYQQGEVDPFSPEDADSDPESMGTASQLEADPATVWELFNVREAGQFDAADAAVFLEPFDRYIKAMSQTTSTPFHEFDSTGDAVSGESRRQTNEAFYSKVSARQMSIGFTWGQLFVDVLGFLGLDVDRVDTVWRPVVPAESLTDVESLNLKRALGVPDEVLLIEMGYAATQVANWRTASVVDATGPVVAIEDDPTMTSDSDQVSEPTE
ncbi:hypothetical protein [Streptomyces sp. NPDC005385]|uniref:hypothetical protein n=1 Tax=Streptomyces sp. NPDC005385 TaxID=3157039 RepID=UPI0033BD2EC1